MIGRLQEEDGLQAAEDDANAPPISSMEKPNSALVMLSA